MVTVKHSPAAVDLHEIIERRRSPRAFSSQPVAPEALRCVLEAARWAASSTNAQPWRFIVTTKEQQPEAYEKLVSVLKESNQRWAAKAPVLILAVAKTVAEHDPTQTNRHAWYDTGAAVAQLTAQATSLGLALRQMGGFYPEQARKAFGIPAGFEPVVAIALGYADAADTLPDDLRERELAPRQRRPLHEIVFNDTWGDPHDITG